MDSDVDPANPEMALDPSGLAVIRPSRHGKTPLASSSRSQGYVSIGPEARLVRKLFVRYAAQFPLSLYPVLYDQSPA